jgi:hypothetical protein
VGSEIQKVASDLRALAKHAKDRGGEVGAAAQKAGQLAEVAHAQGASGLSVARLVGQLQTAAAKAARAEQYIELVGANGEAFADRLAYAVGGQGHSLSLVESVALSVGTIFNITSATAPQQAATDVPSGIDTHQIRDAEHNIEGAATLHDASEAANQLATPSSAAIRPADAKRKRP